MHEPIKRAITFTIFTVATILLLYLALRPNPTPRAIFNILSVAESIRDYLYSFKPFTILLMPAGSGSVVKVSVPHSTNPSQVPIIVPKLELETKTLNVTVVYRDEMSLMRVIPYNVIALPSSNLTISRDVDFSDKRTIVIHDDGRKLRVELVPYYNYTVRGEELIVDIFLFKCSLEIKEKMSVRFLGYVNAVSYLRSYESVGDVYVYFNNHLVVHEYAKVIVIKVHYEVWSIE